MICSKYFRIKYNNSWVELEEFIKNLKSKSNDNILITHKIMNKYIYLYRGKQYKYSDLFMFSEDIKKLIIPEYYYGNLISLEISGASLKSKFLMRLFETLDRYIAKARYELMKSSNIIDIDYLNSNINAYLYEWYYLQRCFNAENAIYSYYSVFEVLMQIIWIYKGYYSGTTFEEVSDCSFLRLAKKLLNDKNPDFFSEFASQNEKRKIEILPQFKIVRDWCNKFKHRGILRFYGEKSELEDMLKVTFKFNDKAKTNLNLEDFSSTNYRYEYIDLDKNVIPTLIKYHKDMINLCNNIMLKMHLLKNKKET